MAKKSKAVKAPASPKLGGPINPQESPEMNDYEAKDHAETLMRAHEIMGDPDKMKKAMKHLHKKSKAIRSIKDMKDYYNEKYSGNHEPDHNEPSEGE